MIPECLLLEGTSTTTPNNTVGPSAAGGGPLVLPSATAVDGNDGSPPPNNNGNFGLGDEGVSIKSELLQESLQLGTAELAIPPAPSAQAPQVVDEDGNGPSLKANKGVILRKSVDYIR